MSSPTSGTQPLCRAALHLPRPPYPLHTPSQATSPAHPCSQPWPSQHRLFLQQSECLCISSSSLCFSATLLSNGAWIPYRGLAPTTPAAGSPKAQLRFPQRTTLSCLFLTPPYFIWCPPILALEEAGNSHSPSIPIPPNPTQTSQSRETSPGLSKVLYFQIPHPGTKVGDLSSPGYICSPCLFSIPTAPTLGS